MCNAKRSFTSVNRFLVVRYAVNFNKVTFRPQMKWVNDLCDITELQRMVMK